MSFLLRLKDLKTTFWKFYKKVQTTKPFFWPHLLKNLSFLICGARHQEFESLRIYKVDGFMITHNVKKISTKSNNRVKSYKQ